MLKHLYPAVSIWFENWGVMGPGLKTGGSWVLKVQQTEARSTGLRVSSLEFVLNIHKSFYFWKVTTLESVFISYSRTLYDIIIFHGDPTIPKFGDRDPQDWHLCLYQWTQQPMNTMNNLCYYSIRLIDALALLSFRSRCEFPRQHDCFTSVAENRLRISNIGNAKCEVVHLVRRLVTLQVADDGRRSKALARQLQLPVTDCCNIKTM